MIKNKKIFVFGMARSGYEVAKFLHKYNNEIIVTDAKEQDGDKVKELENLGIKVIITNKPEDLLDESFDYMVKNPGIIKTHPCVVKAHNLGLEVINEVEVAYLFLPKNINIIAITGSNGKTTTTTITYNILKEAGLPVHLAGNIGTPLSKLVEEIKENDYLVMEISDHQLVDMYKFHPSIAVLTNLSQVHLDFHGNSYDNYKNTKKKLFLNMNEEDVAFLNYNNSDVVELTKDLKTNKKYFSTNTKTDCYLKDNKIYFEDEFVINTNDILVKGLHNYENIMCAIMVAKTLKINNEVIIKVLKEFNGVEHRLEFVRNLNNRLFYNDSKSTNNESTITALKSFDKPTILLLGGLDRNIPFDALTPYMTYVKEVICYGETKNKLKEYCDSINKKCIVLDNLLESTKKAYEISNEGDVILLSPACASWDQYKTFEERGEEFKKIVNELK